jgi:hypothetical protein
MIVVAIIGILAAIAIDNFTTYTYKAKRSELPMIMGGIIVSQNAFEATYDGYANVTAANPGLPMSNAKRPWAVVACPVGCSALNVAACTSFDCTGYLPAGPVLGNYDSPALPPAAPINWEFAVGAQSDVDNDGVAAMELYESGNSVPNGVVPDVLATCGPAIPTGEILNCAPFHY